MEQKFGYRCMEKAATVIDKTVPLNIHSKKCMIRQRAVLKSGTGSSGFHHDESSMRRPAARSVGSMEADVPHMNYFFAFHWICFLIVLYGMMLTHQKLYTSEECDMTWSRRRFLQLNTTLSSPLGTEGYGVQKYPHSYRLFKFIDQRDMRYKYIQSKKVLRSSDSHIWCNPQTSNYNIPIVVYVPGHGGSYEQSRSLGAHGLQLSRRDYSGTSHEYDVHQKLRHRVMNSSEEIPDMDFFFFDVFALDFGEEGGALHGSLLQRQASFISDSIAALSNICNVTKIHVVAHSMGGISSRLALLQNAKSMKVVRNLITLGTPHNAPLWNWETSMFNIYNKLYKGSDSLTTSIVSISGGLRDEMVPSNACYIGNEGVANFTFSILATSIMQQATIEGKSNTPLLGMDHRAIVWCHNVLLEVRSILYNLIHSSDRTTLLNTAKPQQELSYAGFSDKYLESVANLQNLMRVRYGYWESMLMKTSQLYNAEILVKLFACLGAWHYLGYRCNNDGTLISLCIPHMAPMGASIIYFWMAFTSIRNVVLPMESVVILAFVADGIFRFFRLLLCWLLKRSLIFQIFHPNRQLSRKITFFIWLTLYTTAYLLFGGRAWLQPEFVVGVTLILTVLYLAFSSIFLLKENVSPSCSRTLYDREVNFVVWMILLLPFITVGDLYAVLKGLHSWVHCKILIPLALRCAMATYVFAFTTPNRSGVSTEIYRTMITLLRISTVMFGCWNVFVSHLHGEILLHPLPSLIVVAAICDCLEFTFLV